LGGALTRMTPGLPFLVGGLLNGFSIVLTLAFFAQVQRSRSNETFSATSF
jgi:hypothetical protein